MKLTTIIFNLCLCIIVSFKKLKNACNLHKDAISNEDKNLIISLHNEYRNQIAMGTAPLSPKLPPAANMIQMYWSDELALKAQEWADQCRGGNSDKSKRMNAKFKVGENVFSLETQGGVPKPDWKKPLQAWWDESKSFGKKSISNFKIEGRSSENFTQLIWANSYWVGCGFSTFKTVKNTDMSMYVCHYGPSGNNQGKSIYIENKQGGCNCLTGLSCGNPSFKGLCCPNGHCEQKSLVYTGEPFSGTAK